MAGDWIKMRLDLAEDPAVIEMASSLNVREETIVGYCHAFWCWASRQCHDGSVTGVTLSSLGRRLSLPGFPELLVEVGWLKYDESGEKPVITIPNFDRHLSQSAKSRGLAAIRQGRSRSNGSVTPVSRSERDKSATRYTLLFSHSDSSSNSKKKESGALIEVPDSLHTERFKEAWAMWETHRRDIKKKLTPTSVRQQIKALAAVGEDRAVAMILHTIEKGWTGLREPDEKSSKAKPKTQMPDDYEGL